MTQPEQTLLLVYPASHSNCCCESTLILETSAWGPIYNTNLKLSQAVELLVHTDGIYIIGCTKRDVIAAFSANEYESADMGLAVNEGKTKYKSSLQPVTILPTL